MLRCGPSLSAFGCSQGNHLCQSCELFFRGAKGAKAHTYSCQPYLCQGQSVPMGPLSISCEKPRLSNITNTEHGWDWEETWWDDQGAVRCWMKWNEWMKISFPLEYLNPVWMRFTFMCSDGQILNTVKNLNVFTHFYTFTFMFFQLLCVLNAVFILLSTYSLMNDAVLVVWLVYWQVCVIDFFFIDKEGY